ncbi:hypothetical protein M4951_04685 [Blastopirellula sp. J2-11]|uniref:hypothetical protein n=1 Tax=Blastopirellula sp. J2-11 TaxID=2943192 RepID=UPI0021C85B98|nr:hypothetical protein [Blastopirellula sp. J2-11]UUO07605.1 hypothetical protein M4951_04685 [Blastopirellula sp. J2-11]
MPGLAQRGQRILRLACSSLVVRQRNLISILLIANIIFLSFGVRFHGTVLRDLSIPFPCQGGSCGCRDAYTCWNNCCCNTATERLAWAKANGVTPPKNVIARLLQEAAVITAANCSETQQVAACCAAKTNSCCETKSDVSCSTPKIGSCCETKTTPAQPQPYKGPFFTVSRCGGLPELFAIFSSSVVETVSPSWSPRLEFSGYLLALDLAPASIFTTPVSPPPDAIAA